MDTHETLVGQQRDKELLITRNMDASPQLVFQMWTQSEHMAKWLGPHGYEATSCNVDARPGGAFRACIVSPEGHENWMSGVFREVAEPNRLVFTFAWDKEDGQRGPETLITIRILDDEGKTKFEFHQATFQTNEVRDSHRGGWSQTFERLAAYVSSL